MKAESSVATEIQPKPVSTGQRAWLYDVDGKDVPVQLDGLPLPKIGDKQMLWVDVDLVVSGAVEQLWDQLGIPDLTDALANGDPRPHLVRHRNFIQVDVYALRDDQAGVEPIRLHCLVGKNWIATLHDGDLDLVAKFNEPLIGETRLGELDGPRFLAIVLDWLLNGYFLAIDAQQLESDHLDEDLLKGPLDKPESDLLDRLVMMRRRVRRLRTILSQHRELFALLSQPQYELLLESKASSDYERLYRRLERGIDSVDNAREMIVGSFDIFMTQTTRATNETMKRLTLASVLFLPSAVLAGIMGMNFKVGIFERPWMFGVTLAMMATLAGITIVIAKWRDWI